MMKMTDLMHLPGLRFLDLEQVTLQEFLRCCTVAGSQNDATWRAEKPEELPRSVANQHGLQCRRQVRKGSPLMSDKAAC